jgi:hypothetical protein
MSNVQRLFSYGLLSLITSTPIAGGSPTPGLQEDDEDDGEDHTRKGLMNDEGAWCWREECEGMACCSLEVVQLVNSLVPSTRLSKVDKGTPKNWRDITVCC